MIHCNMRYPILTYPSSSYFVFVSQREVPWSSLFQHGLSILGSKRFDCYVSSCFAPTSHPVLPGDERKQPPAHKLIWYYHQKNLEPAPSAASLPEYLWAMRHTKRSLESMAVTPGKTKPVYDMDLATGLFSHDVLTCAYGKTALRDMHYYI